MLKKLYHKLWENTSKLIKSGALIEDDDLVSDTNLFYGDDVKNNSYDVFYPKNFIGRIPTILMLHGGGYIVGKKEGIRNFCAFMAKKGYLVFNIEYTKCDCLEKKYFPYQVEEVFKFYKHISENSVYSNMTDFNNVFVGGDSAGAHIASLVGAVQSNQELKMEFGLQGGPRVKGLILMSPSFGIYNFAGLFPKKIYHEIIFGEKCVRNRMSEYTHVLDVTTEYFPPTLMFSVKHDLVVGVHKRRFLKLAKELGLNVRHYEYTSGYKLFHSCMMNLPDQYPSCFEKIQEFVNNAVNNKLIDDVKCETISEIYHEKVCDVPKILTEEIVCEEDETSATLCLNR